MAWVGAVQTQRLRLACAQPFAESLSDRNEQSPAPVALAGSHPTSEIAMLKGGLLWLLGIPLPIILILWLMGYLH